MAIGGNLNPTPSLSPTLRRRHPPEPTL